MSQPVEIETYLAAKRAQVEDALAVACRDGDERLDEAMRYSLLAGGKRLRPILVLAAAEAVGGDAAAAMSTALAFEMIHTQSLIYDDLPCMDDDDLRRGRPSNHKVFGEATAILAGNALIAKAFAYIANGRIASVPAERLVAAANELATATVAMCAGQQDDLSLQGRPGSAEALMQLHRRKTGALIAGACRAGAWVGGGTAEQVEWLGQYGEALGLTFQIVDDLLDLSATASELGKTPGKDLAVGKVTYPSLYGLEQAKALAQAEADRAVGVLAAWGAAAAPLRELVAYVLQRRH